MKTVNQAMQAYMKDHLSLYVFIGVLFVTGVVFGAVIVNALTLEQNQELSRHLGNFLQSLDQTNQYDSKQSFQQSLILNMKWILLIWFLGLSVIGLPLIFIIDFLKGVLIGFTVGYLIGQFSWKGMLFALVSVVPQNLLIIPAIFICSVSAMSFGRYLIKYRFLQQQGSLAVPFRNYVTTTLFVGVVITGVSFYEAFLSPVLMKWVTPLLVSLG